MSEQTSDPEVPEYADSIDLPDGGKMIIYPISYKLGRQFKSEVAKLADAAVTGPGAIARAGMDDKLMDLMEACCKPSPGAVENLPLSTGAEIMARWITLNLRPERWGKTSALIEAVLKQMTGQSLSLSKIWLQFASPMVKRVETSLNAVAAAGRTEDGASPNLPTEQMQLSES
jgi:hypothetical protein